MNIHMVGFHMLPARRMRKASLVGNGMIYICISSAVIPEVLQSDNGGEFLDEYIQSGKT
jgi:hypothetical protein